MKIDVRTTVKDYDGSTIKTSVSMPDGSTQTRDYTLKDMLLDTMKAGSPPGTPAEVKLLRFQLTRKIARTKKELSLTAEQVVTILQLSATVSTDFGLGVLTEYLDPAQLTLKDDTKEEQADG